MHRHKIKLASGGMMGENYFGAMSDLFRINDFTDDVPYNSRVIMLNGASLLGIYTQVKTTRC